MPRPPVPRRGLRCAAALAPLPGRAAVGSHGAPASLPAGPALACFGAVVRGAGPAALAPGAVVIPGAFPTSPSAAARARSSLAGGLVTGGGAGGSPPPCLARTSPEGRAPLRLFRRGGECHACTWGRHGVLERQSGSQAPARLAVRWNCQAGAVRSCSPLSRAPHSVLTPGLPAAAPYVRRWASVLHGSSRRLVHYAVDAPSAFPALRAPRLAAVSLGGAGFRCWCCARTVLPTCCGRASGLHGPALLVRARSRMSVAGRRSLRTEGARLTALHAVPEVCRMLPLPHPPPPSSLASRYTDSSVWIYFAQME